MVLASLVILRTAHDAVELTGWGGFMFFLLLLALGR